MQRHYRVLWGEDVLAGITFDPSCLRLQLERELKGKLLHLHQGYVEALGRPAGVRRLISVSLPAFLSLFQALLYLTGLAPAPDRRRPDPKGSG